MCNKMQIVIISAQNPLEKNIFSFLTKWRAGSTAGLPIPLLKSIQIAPVEYYYEGRGLKRNAALDRFIIENITASVDTLDVSLTLRFPVLTLVSDNYKLKGWAYYFYPIRGSGKMQLVFRNSVITAKAHFGKIKDDGTIMEDFALIFDVNKIEANLENSSWPINAILNSEGVEILDGYRSTIANALKDYVVLTVNDYLAEIPPAHLSKLQPDFN